MQFNSMAVRAQQKTPAQASQEEDSYDMEISNSEPNPLSMFGDALPSLKLGPTKKIMSSFDSP